MIISALESELPSHTQFKLATLPHTIVTCGMGLLASYRATFKAIVKHNPAFVLNVGSAASISHDLNIGDVVAIDSVYAHPIMDVSSKLSQLGVSLKSEYDVLEVKEVPHIYSNYKKASISSGDFFVTKDNVDVLGISSSASLVDMEAYAIASACRDLDVDFYCVKYISDHVLNGNSESDWKENLQKTSEVLGRAVLDVIGLLHIA